MTDLLLCDCSKGSVVIRDAIENTYAAYLYLKWAFQPCTDVHVLGVQNDVCMCLFDVVCVERADCTACAAYLLAAVGARWSRFFRRRLYALAL